jgi:succinyl-CoA synthetase beta subunit
MYSTEGGMDIEEVADSTPELIFTEEIDPSCRTSRFSSKEELFLT